MVGAKRPLGRPGEEAEAVRQLDRLPHWLGETITGVLETYAQRRGFELIAWYHDLPVWMLEAKPQNRRVQRIQVSACSDRNDRPVLVATGDVYETDESGRVVRVVRSLPEDCVAILPLVSSSWELLPAPLAWPLEQVRSLVEKELPGILDRVWKASASILPEHLEPVGSTA